MLHEFLTLHRDEIIERTRAKVAIRTAPRPTEAELENGVPLFLEQLAETLRREQETPARPTSGEMSQSALLHGGELRKAGFTVAQVVQGYGDVCQAVTELAIELELPISADEFKTLNRCLDEAIAQAVTEFARQRELSLSDRGMERLGFFAHELRNLLSNAMLAFEVLKTGTVGVGGSTGGVLGRNLIALRDLIDRSLAEVRLEAGVHRREPVPLTELMEEVELAAAIEANARGLQLTVTPVEPGVVIDVDRQLIAAALANLLQNAFKFSRPNGHIVLRTDTATTTSRVLIEVEDECGGLPPGRAKDLFRLFAQRSADRSGLGLGLAIACESVETNGGEIRARSLPGRGCIFTIDLPRLPRESATATGDLVAAVTHRHRPGVDRGGGRVRGPGAGPGRGAVPSVRAAQRGQERAGPRPGHRPRERRGQRRRDPGSQPAGPGMHLHDRPAVADSGVGGGLPQLAAACDEREYPKSI